MEKDDNLLNEFINEKQSKKLNIKLIIIFGFIILLLLGFIIMIIIIALQSRDINKLNDKIKDLSIKFDEDIPFLKNKTNYISIIEDKINKTETQLIEREKEIESLKIILEQKDKEIKSFNRNIKKLSLLINDNLENIGKTLNQSGEDIELLKIYSNNLNNSNSMINDSINDIKNKLKQKSEEIDILKDESKNLYILNEKVKESEIKINENCQRIQAFKKVETNLNLLVDFKVKLISNFYMEDNPLNLCVLRLFEEDMIDNSTTKLMAHKNKVNGCAWKIIQNDDIFEFILTDSFFEMNGWKIQTNNDSVIVTNTTKGSTFSLEESSLYKYYKIKEIQTGKYLFINPENVRDTISYYIDLTENVDMATEFTFIIYNES